ncbi:hypothetical protein Trydic_g18678 [Trypoxylus dichotomus]
MATGESVEIQQAAGRKGDQLRPGGRNVTALEFEELAEPYEAQFVEETAEDEEDNYEEIAYVPKGEGSVIDLDYKTRAVDYWKSGHADTRERGRETKVQLLYERYVLSECIYNRKKVPANSPKTSVLGDADYGINAAILEEGLSKQEKGTLSKEKLEASILTAYRIAIELFDCIELRKSGKGEKLPHLLKPLLYKMNDLRA